MLCKNVFNHSSLSNNEKKEEKQMSNNGYHYTIDGIALRDTEPTIVCFSCILHICHI